VSDTKAMTSDNETFYDQYENARLVIDTAASHTGEDTGNTDNK